MGRHFLGVVWLACILTMVGCGDDSSNQGSGGSGDGGEGGGGEGGGGAPPIPCPDGEFDLGNGVCLPCAPGTLEVGGDCQPAGVLPDGCAEGFVHNGDGGCDPVLPPDDCPAGQMAVVGETVCREIAPCGAAPWGDIETDGNTIYVDGSYTGGSSNGSATDPWTTIGEAVSAATTGAVIAIAEGSYNEHLAIYKSVTLWGRCPALVELVGTGTGYSTLLLGSASTGSTVRGMAVRGPGAGIRVWSATDVTLRELWIHDNADRGIDVTHGTSGASATLSDSLLEDNHDHGAIATGASLVVERCLVRGTLPFNNNAGPGLGMQAHPSSGEQGSLTISQSVISGNRDGGVGIYGGVTTIDGSVIRDTLPGASGIYGRGMNLQPDHITDLPAVATVTRSVLANNQEVGIYNGASELIVTDTVIRDTVANSQGQFGRSLAVEAHHFTATPGSIEVTRSLIANGADAGLFSWGSDVTVRSTVVRTSRYGLASQLDGDFGQPSTLDVEGSVIEDSSSSGVLLYGATATIASTSIIGGSESTDYDIRGVSAQCALPAKHTNLALALPLDHRPQSGHGYRRNRRPGGHRSMSGARHRPRPGHPLRRRPGHPIRAEHLGRHGQQLHDRSLQPRRGLQPRLESDPPRQPPPLPGPRPRRRARRRGGLRVHRRRWQPLRLPGGHRGLRPGVHQPVAPKSPAASRAMMVQRVGQPPSSHLAAQTRDACPLDRASSRRLSAPSPDRCRGLGRPGRPTCPRRDLAGSHAITIPRPHDYSSP